MTTQQLIWATCAYTLAFVAAWYFTRATIRRTTGALVAGAVAGAFFLGVLIFGINVGWWVVPLPSVPGIRALFYCGTAISLAPIYLITWRVARRFGWRGLGVCLFIAAIIGPPRDYLFAAVYPEWMVFSPGLAPILAVSAAYAGFVALGHMVMWFVAGPAKADRLALRSWRK